MESKMVTTEHQKAWQEPEVCDLRTHPEKNDMSPALQENFISQWPTSSINQVVYGNVY